MKSYGERQKGKETERQRDGEMERWRDRETEVCHCEVGAKRHMRMRCKRTRMKKTREAERGDLSKRGDEESRILETRHAVGQQKLGDSLMGT